MKCAEVQARLTSYLDGELGDGGSAVRGHLRECEACRDVAADEAALRDGLRALPSVDPPASLWLGIRTQLATEEVRDANSPAWRRALTQWMPMLRRFAPVSAAFAAAALAFVIWRGNRGDKILVDVVVIQPPPAYVAPQPLPHDDFAGDVTADLARDAAWRNNTYQLTADRLIAEAKAMAWSDEQRQVFDKHLVELQAAIDAAPVGHKRDKALREQIKYLTNAVAREEVAAR